jgi:hypothetical protein
MQRGRKCRFQGFCVACNGLDRHPDVVPHAADKHALYALVTSVIMCVFFNLLLVLGPQFPEQPVPGRLAAIQMSFELSFCLCCKAVISLSFCISLTTLSKRSSKSGCLSFQPSADSDFSS